MTQQRTATFGHSATSKYIPDEIQWTAISFVSPSITHFLPCLDHFRALISFPQLSVKTLNHLNLYLSNDAVANTGLLPLEVRENYTHLCIDTTYLFTIYHVSAHKLM
jgi:hypothetical protein